MKMEPFNRELIRQLMKWANFEDRKPLVLRGANQVGKTAALNVISK